MVGFCVLFGFVVLGLFLFSNCLIPFSSHKSCGDFQVLVKGHWTYSWAYVWVRRVSLRLFNLDCRYPRDQLQPARKKKSLHLVIVDLWRPWKVNQKQVKSLTDLLRQLEPSTYSDGTNDSLLGEISAALQTLRLWL